MNLNRNVFSVASEISSFTSAFHLFHPGRRFLRAYTCSRGTEGRKRKETEVHFGTDMKLCDAAAWTTCLSCFRHVTLILRPRCAESLENQEPCTIEFPCVRFCLVTCLLVPVSGHKVAHFRVAREVRASVYSKRVYFLRFSRVNECKNETS